MGATDEVALHEDEPLSIGEAWRTLLRVRTLAPHVHVHSMERPSRRRVRPRSSR